MVVILGSHPTQLAVVAHNFMGIAIPLPELLFKLPTLVVSFLFQNCTFHINIFLLWDISNKIMILLYISFSPPYYTLEL